MVNNQELWQKMNLSKKELIEKFMDRKFGMFIHFGLYSMLAGEWKEKRIEEGRSPFVAEWIIHAFKIPRDEYAQLSKDFNPKDYNVEAIAMLAKNAGMKYIVLTSKHHEGFSLFDSKYSDFNVCKSTPYKRDIVLELYNACKKYGIEFGLYYSHSIDWMDGGDGGINDYKNSENNIHELLHAYNEWDPNPKTFDEYIKTKALPQVREILERFRGMSNIWFDVDYHIPEKYSFEFYKTVYDIQPQTLVSERVGNGYGDIRCPGDNTIPSDLNECRGAWETVGTMNNSWGFKHYDNDWKYPKEVLFWLIEIVSKGGNYMLNIGPDGNGNVPKENVEILTEIGDWLSIYGDAVYGTRKWDVTHEGPTNLIIESTEHREEVGFNSDFTINDFWFTQKNNKVYAISLYSGKVEKLEVKSIIDLDIKRIKALGIDKCLEWQKGENGIEIQLSNPMESKYGFAIEIEYI